MAPLKTASFVADSLNILSKIKVLLFLFLLFLTSSKYNMFLSTFIIFFSKEVFLREFLGDVVDFIKLLLLVGTTFWIKGLILIYTLKDSLLFKEEIFSDCCIVDSFVDWVIIVELSGFIFLKFKKIN